MRNAQAHNPSAISPASSDVQRRILLNKYNSNRIIFVVVTTKCFISSIWLIKDVTVFRPKITECLKTLILPLQPIICWHQEQTGEISYFCQPAQPSSTS